MTKNNMGKEISARIFKALENLTQQSRGNWRVWKWCKATNKLETKKKNWSLLGSNF